MTNAIKALLQMIIVSLQPVPSLHFLDKSRNNRKIKTNLILF
jgi:hypothetical protein